MENRTPERFILNANLVSAIQQYLVKRPFEEVANLVLALQQQLAPQLPPQTKTESPEETPQATEN